MKTICFLITIERSEETPDSGMDTLREKLDGE